MNAIANKILGVGGPETANFPRSFWEEPLKTVCKELNWFDLKSIYLEFGKEETEKRLISLISKEKPDYVFMFHSLTEDLSIPHITRKIKLVSPKTKTILYSGDDDVAFDSTRYLSIFFDYTFTLQNDYVPLFKKDGAKNTFFVVQFNMLDLAPKKTEKKYDVSFIGAPKADRAEILSALNKRGVKIALFGPPSWKDVHELKDIYLGEVKPEDYPEVIRQTKINICLSKNGIGQPHLKTRFFENSACKSFSLVEYCPQLAMLFQDKKNIAFFKDKNDLLPKIDYYLNHDSERANIEHESYKLVTTKFNVITFMQNFILKTQDLKLESQLPDKDFSIVNLNEEILSLPKEAIVDKIRDFEYISFTKGNVKKNNFKDYIQTHSLKRTGKNVSCCDYFMASKTIGDYANFRYVFGTKGKDRKCIDLLNFNQIVLTKSFFINHYDSIKSAYQREKIDFVKEEEIAFVSVPLVSVFDFKKSFYKNPELLKEDFFLFWFHKKLYSKKKNLLSAIAFLTKIFIEGISKRFILVHLFDKIVKKDYFFFKT